MICISEETGSGSDVICSNSGIMLYGRGKVAHGLLQLIIAPTHLLNFMSMSSTFLFHFSKQMIISLHQGSAAVCPFYIATKIMNHMQRV